METLIGTVPDDWSVCKLEECCHVQSGPSGSTLKASDYVTDGVPVVKAQDVRSDGVHLAPRATVAAEAAQRLHRYHLRPGDILLVRIGVTTRHATVTEAQDGWLLGGSCIRVRAERATSSEYLGCYLTHPVIQEWLAEHTQGTVLPTITARIVGALPLVLPPVAVQQRVVDVVRIIEGKIQAHKQVVQTTRVLRELLLPKLLAGAHVSQQ